MEEEKIIENTEENKGEDNSDENVEDIKDENSFERIFTIPEESGFQMTPLVPEMKTSYLNYAMSVIVSRALPDVRDGLKPVHRRILYAMWSTGLKSTAKFKKSAHVVGEVMAKYHPHGDAAIYDTMVRLAQDFSMRYPLVHGQGNFGSVDGDGAAAMRYTEAKLTKIAEELLYDIDKNTVDWTPTYDDSNKEPSVLPAKIPALLMNGSMGIAVGMATNIPPHNLTELCDGISFVIENPDADIDQIMEFIKGPDFPTGGIIYDIESIKKAYSTGRGGIVMRGRAEIEEHKAGYFRIIISEIPYQVNKSTLVEKIADLAKNKVVDGIKALRDESDRNGMRIVIELKKDCYPEKVLNSLFKHTQLQSNFNVNTLALVNTIEPKVLSLKNIIDEFITHRRQVITRRTEFELDEAKKRAHILEGLKIAIDNIDEVIATIKKSENQDKARENLMKKFKLSELQANAILEMQLRRLAALERQKIEDELKEILLLIERLEEILSDVKKIDKMIKEDLADIQKKYGDKRKTKIIKSKIGEFSAEDLIPKEPTVVITTKGGYIKRILPDTFKAQKRGGKGVIGLTTKETDLVNEIFITNTHSDVLFFTTSGRVFRLKIYDIPETTRTSRGQALVNFLQIPTSEKVSSILPMDNIVDAKYLLMVTKKGTIKKVKLSSFDNVRKSGLIAINLKDDDVLEWAKTTTSKNDIFITTANGQSIRFNEDDIRPTGRSAAGVRGIRLKKEDIVVGFDVVEQDDKDINLLSVAENGYAKFTSCDEYKTQKRGGSGMKTMNIEEKTGKLVSSKVIKEFEDKKDESANSDLIIVSRKGQIIRISLKAIPILKRATRGVRVMKFKKLDDRIACVSVI